MQKLVRIKSFDLVAQDIAEVEVRHLHALATAVGWPHRPNDIDFLRQVGRGIAAVDGIGRVFGSAMWFPQGEDFATIGMVITTPRTQSHGTGRWLMEQVLDRCGHLNLSLNATRPAHPLYLSLGFADEAVVFQRQGEAVAQLPALPPLEGEVLPLPANRIGEVAALDASAFGVDRSRLLAALAQGASVSVLLRDGKAAGYAVCREFGRGHTIGPLVAANDQDAIHLAAVHLKALAGHFARLDTREATGDFAGFLERCGLGVYDTCVTMSRGRPFLTQAIGAPRVFGLAGHALS